MTEAGAPDALREAERRIDWILAHPGMSDWLKDALRSARWRDPSHVINDVEVLGLLLSDWSLAMAREQTPKAELPRSAAPVDGQFSRLRK